MSNASSETPAILSETCKTAQSSVALFDVSDRSQIEITGADRVTFLHGFTSNDVKRLKPGQGCETFLTSLKGKVVAHLFVFCASESLWLDGSPGQVEMVLSHLKKYLLIEDVQLISHAADRGELYVSGPLAPQLLQLDQGMPVATQITRETNGESFDIRRVDLFEAPGFLLSIPKSQLQRVKQSLVALNVPEGTAEDFDALRINAGYPRFGIDFTGDNLVQEVARTKQCVSFNKGCYLGQETVARIDAIGHTNQELHRIRFETCSIPPAGTVVFDATGGTEVGVITSAAPAMVSVEGNPDHSIISIGMIKRVANARGTIVQLKSDNQTIAGQVL